MEHDSMLSSSRLNTLPAMQAPHLTAARALINSVAALTLGPCRRSTLACEAEGGIGQSGIPTSR